MFPIVAAQELAKDIKRLTLFAPRIARRHQPGQFVIVRVHEHGERIPLTIADSDRESGHITIIVQTAGKTTALLNMLEPGDCLLDVVGPLGKPSEIERYGNAVVIGGGVGTAIAYPTARALHAADNHVTAIVGARTRDLLILESEMRAATDELLVMTDDGSYGEKGFVTDALRRLMAERRLDYVLAIGPVPMMKAVAEVTRPQAIHTFVSLNAIMVDGTGMCGGCRVSVNEGSQFACVDGPEFDAHRVDFDVLSRRNRQYRSLEAESMAAFHADPTPDLELMRAAGQLTREIGPHPARMRSVAR
ncbi:MAG: sulfide/dihydroorotate dehydrogenase-like FAD/NAD-binding protein [Candidatus Koribacter versatilis]|uniref:Sulfide/dihydroorotate dehydrogenase-like FAD/NAD-binding protein n=1 Tax=Candidatus Korobacter versatilis TaxID=658062 RepID=A0A932ERA7_9BACT|nr:sulfide/dihydroorotate dehydrogenase-like FAD/NAD-binding protein [Candidatus Koribacter versatilis]